MRRHHRRRHPLYAPHRHHRRRRRSNPIRMTNFFGLLKIGLWGGLGIVTARVGGSLYTKYAAPSVLGTDTTQTWRTWLNEGLRLMAMGALTIGVEAAVVKRIASPAHRLAFRVGGLAEVGRQAVGVLVKQFSPSTDLTSFGLNGYAGMEGVEDVNSFLGAGRGGSGYYAQLAPGSMDGVEDVDAFDGYGLEGAKSARGRTSTHPFATGY
jgi:hypothetical protein